MTIEISDIQLFMQQHEPFDALESDAIVELCTQVEVSYFRAGTDILHFGDKIDALYVVRSGAVEVYRRNGELYNRLEPGAVFGQMGILMNGHVRFPVKALEDTLVYLIPAQLFLDFCDRFNAFGDFFEVNEHSTLKQAIQSQADNNDMTTVRVKHLVQREPISVPAQTSIQACAQLMTEQRASSLVIMADKSSRAAIEGIVTDRDLRSRVLAQGIDVSQPISKVMSTEIITLDEDAYVYEAMLTMLRFNVHHLPIVDDDTLKGVIALSDIVRHESQSSLFLVRSILAQNTVEELTELSQQVPNVFVRMVNEGANSHMVGSAMSVIGRSFKQRLLDLAEAQFGAPPVPYCFLALGSMARDEQLLVTDQDNALILDDRYDDRLHGQYFETLAQFVCDGLAACGYSYCTGGIMASNPQWRLTRSQWQAQFLQWIEQPDPKALLNASIFFDLDGVWGKLQWSEELKKFIALHAKGNKKFLAHLARNALSRTPPLGFFKDFVLEKDGRQRFSINLKRRGTAPLADVVRVHALAQGSLAQNSFERLDDIRKTSLLPTGKAEELADALEFISLVRIRHQAWAVEHKDEPDNNIEPDLLTAKDRRGLKEAFQLINSAQRFLKYRYTAQNHGR